MHSSETLGMLLAGILLLLSSCSSAPITSRAGTGMPVEAFPITQVKLLEGSFLHTTQLNVASPLGYDPDRQIPKIVKYGSAKFPKFCRSL